MDRHVADTEFVDGVWRPVYETPDGRQYVVDDEGEQVFGFWYMPRNEWDAMFPGADRSVIVQPDLYVMVGNASSAHGGTFTP